MSDFDPWLRKPVKHKRRKQLLILVTVMATGLLAGLVPLPVPSFASGVVIGCLGVIWAHKWGVLP